MSSWLTGLRERPIAEQERRVALAATAAVLLAATVMLTLTRPSTHSTPAPTKSKPSAAPAISDPSSAAQHASPLGDSWPVEAATSRAFLAGYLAYTYGRGSASGIANADPSLIASLHANPPRVPPAMRTHAARVLDLHSVPAPSGQLGVDALVNDGTLVDYTVVLVLARRRGRLLVVDLEPQG